MYSITFQQRYYQTYSELTSACYYRVYFWNHGLNVNPIYVVMQNETDSCHDYGGVHTE